jgi:hypothetical protein
MITKRYAVVKKWKDNPKDFQVLEYIKNKVEGNKYIKTLPKDPERFTYEIMKYI